MPPDPQKVAEAREWLQRAVAGEVYQAVLARLPAEARP